MVRKVDGIKITNVEWDQMVDELDAKAIYPSQSGHNGKYLTTNGLITSWGSVDASIDIGDNVGSGTQGSILFLGSGSLLAQDNTNLFWDDTSNFLGLGTSSPTTRLTVATTSTSLPRGIRSMQFSTDTGGAEVGFAKARCSVASPTTIVTGDTLGRLTFEGYDGANYQEMASIEAVSTGTVASGRVPTYLKFQTATNANPSVMTERMRIDETGAINIGQSTAGGRIIQHKGSGQPNMTADQIERMSVFLGLYHNYTGVNPTIGVYGVAAHQRFVMSQSFINGYYLAHDIQTYIHNNGSPWTLTFAYGLRVYNIQRDNADSTVINTYTGSFKQSSIGTTRNITLHVGNIASTSVGNWNIYADGTYNNYFYGNLLIGAIGPSMADAATARVNIEGGTTTVAALKIKAGSLLTTPTASSFEWNGQYFYATTTSPYGEQRKRFFFDGDSFSTDLSFLKHLDHSITIERSTGTGTQGLGFHLTLQPSSPTFATADKNGGNLILNAGISTGTGTSKVLLKAPRTSTTGSVVTYTMTDGGDDYTVEDMITLNGGGNDATFNVTEVLGAVISYNIVDGGTGYTVNDVLTTEGWEFGTGAQITIDAVDENGTITDSHLTTAGTGYVSWGSGGFTGGTGNGAMMELTAVDNAITSIVLLAGGTGYTTTLYNTTGGTGSGAQITVNSISRTDDNNPTTEVTIENGVTTFGSSNTLIINNATDNVQASNLTVTNFLKTGGDWRVNTQLNVTSTSFSNITDLSASLIAGKKYAFRIVLFVDASITGGHKYDLNGGTATVTNIIWQVNSINNITNLNIINSRQTALSGSVGQAGATTVYTEIIGSITVNTAGTFKPRFAQNATNGTSSVLAGSFMEIRELN